MCHVVSTNLNNDQVHYTIDDVLKFDSNSSLSDLIQDTQPVVTFDFRKGKNTGFPCYVSLNPYKKKIRFY